MKRMVVTTVILVVAFAAMALPEPAPVPGPTFSGAVEPDAAASDSSSVWYCPWVDAGAEKDAAILMASTIDVEAVATLPSPINDEQPDEATRSITGPGAQILNVGDLVRRGAAPGFVEYSDGPAATGAWVSGDQLLSGDRCTAAVSKLWHLPGLTTREGRAVTLRLFNPFLPLAKVSVGGSTEFGALPLPELATVDVPPRGWVDIDLNPLIPFFDDLTLFVTTEEGLVIPTVTMYGEGDEVSLPASGLSTTWEFPVVSVDTLTPTLMISNPGPGTATVTLDVFTTAGAIPDAASFEVGPESPLRVALDEVVDGKFGLRLSATGPISAAVVAEDAPSDVSDADPGDDGDETDEEPVAIVDRLAGTVGAAFPSSRWLLPGAGAVPDATSSLWILNTDPEPATVTIQPLGVRSLPADKVIVAPGTVLEVPLAEDVQIGGYLLDASIPVTAAWSAARANSVAFFAGTALDV
jgi:hypothetical protein